MKVCNCPVPFEGPAIGDPVAMMDKIRAACEAAGWRYFKGSETLRAWCGEPDGIAHLPTVAGEANVSDSVYDSWQACYAENVASGERTRRRRRRKRRPAPYADKLAIADACNLDSDPTLDMTDEEKARV